MSPEGRCVSIDTSSEMVALATELSQQYSNVEFIHSSFPYRHFGRLDMLQAMNAAQADGTQPVSSTDAQPVVLLLPGMSLNETIFPKLPFPTISCDYNGIILPGGGPEPADDKLAAYRQVLSNQLRSDRRWHFARRRIVVGHSFGGMLALDWLTRHETSAAVQVDGVVLISATGGRVFDAVKLRLFGISRAEMRVPVKWIVQFWTRPTIMRAMKRLTCRGSLAVGRVDFGALEAKSDLAIGLAGWRNTDWRAMRSYRLAMDGFDVTGSLFRLTVPTVVLHGSKDSLLPVSEGRKLAEALPHAEFRVVEGAGHMLPLTHGEEVERSVTQLLGTPV